VKEKGIVITVKKNDSNVDQCPFKIQDSPNKLSKQENDELLGKTSGGNVISKVEEYKDMAFLDDDFEPII
jgi:hypothetical protein